MHERSTGVALAGVNAALAGANDIRRVEDAQIVVTVASVEVDMRRFHPVQHLRLGTAFTQQAPSVDEEAIEVVASTAGRESGDCMRFIIIAQSNNRYVVDDGESVVARVHADHVARVVGDPFFTAVGVLFGNGAAAGWVAETVRRRENGVLVDPCTAAAHAQADDPCGVEGRVSIMDFLSADNSATAVGILRLYRGGDE